MSLRLAAISLYLRLAQKPHLARARDPLRVRAGFDKIAARWFNPPRDTNTIEDRIEGTPVLSMGMSGDFEAAIAEGSTLVRIGTALFGQRAP